MPSGRTHLVVATAASTALTCGLGLPVEYALIGAIGGLVPDCDHRKSMMGAVLPLWLIMKHRGFTHSLCGCILFMGIVYGLSGNAGAAWCFGIGYGTHLLLDWSTPRGIPLRWPRKKRYRLRRWK